MKAKTFLSKIFFNVIPLIHKTRLLSLFASVESAINGATFSVTGLGRNIDGKAKEKHRIKRADRLCSNNNLYREKILFINEWCNSGGGVLSVVPEVELQSYKYNAGNKIRTDGFKSSILYKNDSYINSNKFKLFDNFFFQVYVGIDGKIFSK